MMSVQFSPSVAFDVQIGCQNYLKGGRALFYDAKTGEMKHESHLRAALRFVSWLTVLPPLVAAISWCVAHIFAKKAIEERSKYWGGTNPNTGRSLLLTGSTQLRLCQRSDSERTKMIKYLSNSALPKTHLDCIFIAAKHAGESYLLRGNDAEFRHKKTAEAAKEGDFPFNAEDIQKDPSIRCKNLVLFMHYEKIPSQKKAPFFTHFELQFFSKAQCLNLPLEITSGYELNGFFSGVPNRLQMLIASREHVKQWLIPTDTKR